MARRKLSTQGRVVAAGLSIGVAGMLAGFMAAGDHTAGASQPASASTPTPTGSFDTPYDDGGASRGASADTSGTIGSGRQYSPQPQTRTGGS